MREVPIQVSSNLGDICTEPWSGVVKVFGEYVSSDKVKNAGLVDMVPVAFESGFITKHDVLDYTKTSVVSSKSSGDDSIPF